MQQTQHDTKQFPVNTETRMNLIRVDGFCSITILFILVVKRVHSSYDMLKINTQTTTIKKKSVTKFRTLQYTLLGPYKEFKQASTTWGPHRGCSQA